MRRKRKKILKVSVLFILTVSTLLGTFSIFSSASSDGTGDFGDDTPGLLGPNDPAFIYYPFGFDSEARDSSLWQDELIVDGDQIVFGLIGRTTLNSPWHIVPYIRGRDLFSDVVKDYNDQVKELGYTTLANCYSRSNLVSSGQFSVLTAYSDSDAASCCIILRLSKSALETWPYDWIPLYFIRMEFIDKEGETGYYDRIESGSFDDSISMGYNSVFSQGLLKYSFDTTFQYPYINVSGIMDQSVSGEDGIQIHIQEWFYNKSAGYPSGKYHGDSYFQNLYPTSFSQPYTSYGFNYHWSRSGEIMDKAYSKGFNDGQKVGYNNGYSLGKSEGIEAGSNYNAVDGIISLAQVPGAFISGMLDFEVFGINLASTVKVIFTLLIVAFLIVFILKFIL